jgi:hypothetical protein
MSETTKIKVGSVVRARIRGGQYCWYGVVIEDFRRHSKDLWHIYGYHMGRREEWRTAAFLKREIEVLV